MYLNNSIIVSNRINDYLELSKLELKQMERFFIEYYSDQNEQSSDVRWIMKLETSELKHISYY